MKDKKPDKHMILKGEAAPGKKKKLKQSNGGKVTTIPPTQGITGMIGKYKYKLTHWKLKKKKK